MIVTYGLAWVPMVLIAIVNGALREAWYGPYLGELRAHQVSTLTAVLLFGLYIGALTYIWPLTASVQAVTIGVIWLALTVGFEMLFGHYVLGHPWGRLLHDSNIFTGRVWIAVPLWITVAPAIFYRLAN